MVADNVQIELEAGLRFFDELRARVFVEFVRAEVVEDGGWLEF